MDNYSSQHQEQPINKKNSEICLEMYCVAMTHLHGRIMRQHTPPPKHTYLSCKLKKLF
jgi:uncharacterized protein (DUF1015 family)